jgi:hypothetical protein
MGSESRESDQGAGRNKDRRFAIGTTSCWESRGINGNATVDWDWREESKSWKVLVENGELVERTNFQI